MVSKGVWVDDPTRKVTTAKFWNNLVDHGFNTAALMLEGMGNGFNPKYSMRTLEKVKDLALSRDLEVVLTVWPEPNKTYLEQFEQKIGPMLDISGASGLEFDCEGNWLKSKVRDFSSLDAAGDELVRVFKSVSARHDVRTEVTTYPYHRENGRTADVAPHASRLLPQAYSVRNRSQGSVDWDSRHGPGGMQKLTLGRAETVPNSPKLSCGLAAYDQVWPGKKGEDAMQHAWDASLEFNPIEVRFWSSKWILGIKSNGYASRFIKSLP